MLPHEVLGVPAGAGREEVAAAFRRYALRHHPDQGGDPARFQAGIEAYRRLTDGRAPGATGAGSARPRSDVVFHRRSRAALPTLLRLARRRLPPSRQR